MATGGVKTSCSICQKTSASLMCRGCGKDFCYSHVAEHRQELTKQMDEIITSHDQFQQEIAEQEAQPRCHPVMKDVDQWEQQSINKIRQAAEDARRRLSTILNQRRTQVTNDLVSFTTELSTARKDDDYFETDLKKWTDKLENLKADLNAVDTIDFYPIDDETSFIPKYFINEALTDIFYQTINDIRISEAGKVATRGPGKEIAVARCIRQYSQGQHRFGFRIEQLSNVYCFDCGIVSKNTPTISIIQSPPPGAYLNNNVISDFRDSGYQLCPYHTYEILIDCTQKLLQISNKQLDTIGSINIDLVRCPFPWQFFMALRHPNDRARLY